MNLRNLRLGIDLVLHHDLIWTDEHSWSPVVQTVEHTLNGAIAIDVAKRQAGRPISLSSPRDDMAWHTRATVDALAIWAAMPGETFDLTLDDGRKFTVIFRHQEAPVIESKPVRGHASYEADDFWQVKLKFMEI